MTRRPDQSGQVTAFVVVFAAALLLFTGLVIDGGLALAAKRRAINEAEAAARAGAQAVNVAGYRAGGPFALDPVQASAAAHTHLAGRGHSGQVRVEGDRVTVTVAFDQPMRILGLGGLGSVRVEGRGTARAARPPGALP